MKYLILISSLFSFLFCLLFRDNNAIAYHSLFYLPLVFFIGTSVIFLSYVGKKTHIVTLVFIIISWIRFVLVPLLGTVSGYYNHFGILADSQSIRLGINLMIYEYIFISVLLVIIQNMNFFKTKEKSSVLQKNIILLGSKKFYFIFAIFSLVIFLLFGRHLDLFSFLVIGAENSMRIGDATSIFDIGVRQLITSGMLFAYLTIIFILYRKYKKSSNIFYFHLILLVTLLFVSIIVGERRSIQLYLAFASSFTLISLLPHKKKTIFLTTSVGVLIILSFMTIYKSLDAYIYGSYTEALSNSAFNLIDIVHNLELYFYGVTVVGSNISLVNHINILDTNIFVDILSSLFGLHFLVPDNIYTTSQLYNQYIYTGRQLSGHLISSIGYGYIYLPLLLAPLITVFNLIISFILEKLMKNAISLEMKFIYSYIFIRFSFGVFSNPTSLVNMSTQYFLLNGLVFLVAIILVRNNNRDSNLSI